MKKIEKEEVLANAYCGNSIMPVALAQKLRLASWIELAC